MARPEKIASLLAEDSVRLAVEAARDGFNVIVQEETFFARLDFINSLGAAAAAEKDADADAAINEAREMISLAAASDSEGLVEFYLKGIKEDLTAVAEHSETSFLRRTWHEISRKGHRDGSRPYDRIALEQELSKLTPQVRLDMEKAAGAARSDRSWGAPRSCLRSMTKPMTFESGSRRSLVNSPSPSS